MVHDVNAPGDWGSKSPSSSGRCTSELFALPDGCQLFLRSWQGKGQDVLLLLHGLGGHSGWYIDMGNQLAASGLSVYAVDHRGFGRSEGPPGHIERANTYISDLVALLTELRQRHSVEAKAPRLYILGHSMGGIFAACLAAQHSDLLAGVLFLNPWVQDNSKPSLRMLFGVLGGGLIHSQRRWRTPGSTALMTSNPEAARMLENDPYWRRQLTESFFLQILQMRLQVLKQARKVTLPALVMQADQDKSVLKDASRKLYEALASRDKSWISYPDYAHDTQFEADRAQLDQDIVEWIQAHAETQ